MNEAHVFIDAGIGFSVWPPSLEHAEIQGQCSAVNADKRYMRQDEHMFTEDCSSGNTATPYNVTLPPMDASATWAPSTGMLLMDKLLKEVMSVAAGSID